MIRILVGAKCMNIMIFNQLDLKRKVKNHQSNREAHFCMVKLRVALGISRIQMLFFLEVGT